jgi:hypothetical protein
MNTPSAEVGGEAVCQSTPLEIKEPSMSISRSDSSSKASRSSKVTLAPSPICEGKCCCR